MKTNDSFSGVKTLRKWIQKKFKHYMYSNGKEWEYSLKENEFNSSEIAFKENSIKDIDRKVINRFSSAIKGKYFFDDIYNCDVFYKVIII